MPKTRTLTPALPVNDIGADLRVLTAAGRRLPPKPDYNKVSRGARGWQDEGWRFYDLIGEYRYACDWVGNILSKATLFLTYGGKPVTGEVAGVDYVYSLFGGPQAQGQMLRETGVHLTVAGELFIVGITAAGVEQWMVVAATELTARGGRYYVSGKEIKSDGEPFIARIWRPHPRKYTDATSPSRAVLPILAELDALTRRIFAEIDSRLAGAGVFFVPSEMTMPTTQADADQGAAPTGNLAAAFQTQLTDAMVTAIADREDASAMVPIVVTAPGEHIGNARHITFWSPLDEKSIELRTEAIRRLALGLDMPPEVLTGIADVNHWTAWAVEEGAIKAHAEPLLALICSSLTEAYLQPLLVQDGMADEEAEKYAIAADTSLMRLRPNRSKEALELYDRMQLDGAALRRENGFDEADSPDDDELKSLFIRKVASGSTTPELVAAALRALGVPIAPAAPAAPAEARPTPSLMEHPHEGPPDRPEQSASLKPPGDGGLLGASEVMVYRALERAGNRLRSKIGSNLPASMGRTIPAGTPASEVHLHVPVTPGMLDDLLADAFSGLDRYTTCRDVDANALAARLDAYCRSLLISRARPDPDVLTTLVMYTPVDGFLAKVG